MARSRKRLVDNARRRTGPRRKRRKVNGDAPAKTRMPKGTKMTPKALAEAVFDTFGGEVESWDDLMGKVRKSKSHKQEFDILRYWTDRQHGKATQAFDEAGPGSAPLRVIWDVPRPIRESAAPGGGDASLSAYRDRSPQAAGEAEGRAPAIPARRGLEVP